MYVAPEAKVLAVMAAVAVTSAAGEATVPTTTTGTSDALPDVEFGD